MQLKKKKNLGPNGYGSLTDKSESVSFVFLCNSILYETIFSITFEINLYLFNISTNVGVPLPLLFP